MRLHPIFRVISLAFATSAVLITIAISAMPAHAAPEGVMVGGIQIPSWVFEKCSRYPRFYV